MYLLWPVLAALVVTVLLFLVRKKTIAPWVWVPVAAWCAWGCLSLLPMVLPRDPYYGPPEWSLFGYDALLVGVCLYFSGTLLVGTLICFPRKNTWRVTAWLGGCMAAIFLPLTGWLLFTNPYSLQLVGPDGKPVAGATVYQLKPGLGNRLASVTVKTSDAQGVVVYRSFRGTKLALLVPGNASWVNTEIVIHPPREGYGSSNPFNFRKELSLSWGNHPSTRFDQALSRLTLPQRIFADRKVSGRVGWMIREEKAKELIPVFLHSGDQPIDTGLLELLRAQLKDRNLVARFPSFVHEIAYDGYGILLSQEIRDIHNQTANTDIQLESQLRGALSTQAEFLAYLKDKIERIQRATGTAREVAIDDIRPCIGWARVRPIHLDLEQELPLISEKVNVAGQNLLEHIRNHPATTDRSLKDFESRLAAPGLK